MRPSFALSYGKGPKVHLSAPDAETRSDIADRLENPTTPDHIPENELK
jgi:hypothetical protein